DGGDKRNAWLVDELGPRVEWVPVCPEVEAGLGTPRQPMKLVRTGDRVEVVTTRPRPDLTAALRACSERRVDELAASGLDGYVLKAGSPSCAVESTGEVAGPRLVTGAVVRRVAGLPGRRRRLIGRLRKR